MLNPQSSESVSCPELTHLPELKQGQLFFLLRLKKNKSNWQEVWLSLQKTIEDNKVDTED